MCTHSEVALFPISVCTHVHIYINNHKFVYSLIPCIRVSSLIKNICMDDCIHNNTYIHMFINIQYCLFMLTSFIKSLRNFLSQVTWKTFVNFRNKCRYVCGIHTYIQLQYFVCLAVLIQIHTYVCMYELNMLTYNCLLVCVFKRSFPLSQSLSKVCTYKHTYTRMHIHSFIHLVKVVWIYCWLRSIFLMHCLWDVFLNQHQYFVVYL